MSEILAKNSDQGLAGTCMSCPFNVGMNEEADQAWNYGCLPDKFEITALKIQHDRNWECHSREGVVCTGLCHQAKDSKLDMSSGLLTTLSTPGLSELFCSEDFRLAIALKEPVSLLQCDNTGS